MDVTSTTVGIPVRDLAAARAWYDLLLDRSEPDLVEIEHGIVEYRLGDCWLQLAQGLPTPSEAVLRLGVADVRSERDRLVAIGIAVGEITVVPGLIVFCNLLDPDGNRLGLYTVPDETTL